MNEAVFEFIAVMGAAGVRPLEPIADKLATGGPIRFRAEGDKPGRRNGWALLHLDGVPAGVFRHYRLDIRQVWRAGGTYLSLSPTEQRAFKAKSRESERRRNADTLRKQQAVAIEARNLWRGAHTADPNHAYLGKKDLPPLGIRQQSDALLVPMVDLNFRLWNMQRIFPNGRKLFLKGGRTAGLFWPYGVLKRTGAPADGPLVIGEGFATMAAVHDATGHGVISAMSARNLEAVAISVRRAFPGRTLIIAADDDYHLPDNIGLKAARFAANSVGGLLAVPALPITHRSSVATGLDFADIPRIAVAAIVAGIISRGTDNAES